MKYLSQLAGVTTVALVACTGCQLKPTQYASESLQSRLDTYCAERGKESVGTGDKPTRVEDFFSPAINTCVHAEVSGSEKNWSYYLRDITNGFMRGPKWTKADIPLKVYNYERLGTVHADGFWVSTDSTDGKQLVAQIAVKLECNRRENVCREHDASMTMGMLEPNSVEYDVSTWTKSGIVADDSDEGNCAIGHRLSIDFSSNSVTVTDYPKRADSSDSCKAFQNANSYALHGGSLIFYGQNQLFDCSSDGTNSAVLSKVAGFKGDVADKNYTLWMDDGDGGPPATVKTPPRPYTRSDCERLMQKKLKELKGE